MAPIFLPLKEKFREICGKLKSSEDSAAFQNALNKDASARGRVFLSGVRAYQYHPVTRNAPPAPIVWQKGTTKLLDYAPDAAPEVPVVLVIPSLVNRFHILDLAEDFSLLRFMAAQGLRPMVVDWDAPGEEEKDFTLTDYVVQRLFPILDYVTLLVPQCRLLGYCMGGLLALALAVLRRDQVSALALMATPWESVAGEGFLELADKLEPYLVKQGHLPVVILQTLFTSFQATSMVAKFTRFASLDSTSEEARRFVLTEDWLNDGVPLTAPVARECLRGWYGENTTGALQWRVAGQRMDPRKLMIPSYVLVPRRDRIVTPESALPLAGLLRRSTLHEPDIGHIGLLAGHGAVRDVWLPMVRWLMQCA